MMKSKVIFQSKEEIYGIVPRSNDWVHYSCTLSIKDSGKAPVYLEMIFNPPHPYLVNMPEKHTIKAESISSAYSKVYKFFKKFGVEFM